jgi:hypothetical protein
MIEYVAKKDKFKKINLIGKTIKNSLKSLVFS